MGLLDGSRKPVTPSESGYALWDAENSMLMSWLINSMEPEISQGYIFYTTAKDIWDAVNLTQTRGMILNFTSGTIRLVVSNKEIPR